MAKANKKAAPAKEEKKAAKAAPAAAKGKKKTLSAEEKAAKRAAMKERLANRPAGQRPNSKQIDVIEIENGGKVLNFGAPVRKQGTLVTSVAIDAEGNVVSTAVALVQGVRVKTKKGHGYLQPGVPGMGKGKGAAEGADNEDDDDEEDED